MASAMMEAQIWQELNQVVKLLFRNKLYTHCAAHQLNLSIVAGCKIQAFRNAESCIGEIAKFLTFHQNGNNYLINHESITKGKKA